MSNDMTEKEKEAAYGEKCPVCSTPWTKTPKNIGGHWFHCVPCKKKAEDLVTKNSKQLDLFESELGGIDWDDWKVF